MHALLQLQISRQQELGLAGVVSFAMILLIVVVIRVAPTQFSADVAEVLDFEPIAVFPDFASIDDVSVKKEIFFDYVQDYVDAKNENILQLRRRLEPLAELAQNHTAFSEREAQFVQQMAERYRVDSESYSQQQLMVELMERVDIIPPSLVLAQAANESAWGTSRFAVDGNNLFGQWCYIEGCGFVPRRRASGATHEVKRFDSVADAVAGYFLNLNTNQPYDYLRELRSHMRAEDQPIDSMVLAFGLGRYSQRGEHYVDELQNIIAQNELYLRDNESAD